MANPAGGDGNRNERRYPRNLQGILNFCTEHTKTEDAPASTSGFTQMDPERRQWLENALAEMAGTDPIKVMLEHIKLVTEPGDQPEDIQKKEDALEEVQSLCEDIDLACDFVKIGGLQLLIQLLKSDHAGYRWRAAELCAIIVQNNPYCQKAALDAKMLPLLLQVLDTDPNTTVQIKALYAISCMTRDVPEGQKEFEANDGFSVVLRAMQSEEQKLQMKAAFMLRALCIDQPQYRDTLCDIGMVEQLVALLQREHSATHEHLMGALLSLVQGHPRSTKECQRPELQLQDLLKHRKDFLKGKEEFEEELEHAQQLHKYLFADGNQASSSVDR